MKKLLAIFVSLILSVSVCFAIGCNQDDNKEIVSVQYFASASDMIPMLKTGKLSIGLLPEPAATQLTKVASDKTWYRMDLQEIYDGENKAYPQAVMLIKQSVLNTYPNIVSSMESAFNDNVQWVKDNTELAVNVVNANLEEGATPSLKAQNITSAVVDGCKIYWQGATGAKETVKSYVDDIISVESSSAKTVSDDFFYTGESTGAFSGEKITVVAPDGAPALAIAKFINDNQNFGTGKTFSYKVVSSSKIGAAVQQGTGDIVIIPVNAASKLYKANSNDTYKMVSVVTHGNLYIMSTEKIESIIALKNKTLGVIGQGLVPDLTLKAVLNKNNMIAKIAE